MIDERANLHFLGQLPDTTYMVVVIVSDNNVVNLTNARELCGGGNAVRISALKTWPTCIDQHGLAGGTDDQRCLSPFNIDEVDVEWFLSLCEAEQREE